MRILLVFDERVDLANNAPIEEVENIQIGDVVVVKVFCAWVTF